MTVNRIYEMACTFPALQRKGVENGDIPGITSSEFNDFELSKYLYNEGGVLSHGEFLLLEGLLNLYDPYTYPEFNFGDALRVFDPTHIMAFLTAAVRINSGT